jgi:hypothetical protein
VVGAPEDLCKVARDAIEGTITDAELDTAANAAATPDVAGAALPGHEPPLPPAPTTLPSLLSPGGGTP